MNKRAVIGAICAVSTLFALQGSALTFADNTTDFSITVNPSLSLSVSSDNVGFSITPSKNGVFNSDGFNVYASTNNATGYTLTMSTNNVNLKSSTINVNTGDYPTIPTITETNDGISASAFEASTDPTILNHYGISIAGANFNAMKAEKEIATTSSNNVTQDTYAIVLASKLDLNTVPGIYSTTINFQAVVNSVDPVQPYPPDPCDSDIDCDSTSGTTLQRAYELAYTAAHKGMWEEITPGSNTFQYIDSWNGVNYQGQGRDVRFLIQDMTPSICNTATVIGSTALVLDVRDQTSYRIKKLADGSCWMLDNLAIDPTDTNIRGSLGSTNTNASNAALRNLTGIESTTKAGWATTSVVNTSSAQYSYTSPFVNNTVKNNVSPNQMDQDGGWKNGVYYNICAISAGTYCYAENSYVDIPDTAIDISEDLCPSNWRLSTAGPSAGADYGSACSGQYCNVNSFRSLLHLPMSCGPGWVAGSSAMYLSSTISGNGSMYVLRLDSYVDTAYNAVSYFMLNARCVAKTGTEPAPSGN